MAQQFYTILTNVGKAKIANASALGIKVNFKYFALGDGNGSYYNPIETQTTLKNEVWRGQIGSVTVDEENPNWIVLETIIPTSVGGFMIREAGVFDENGNMLAVGKYPETYKPVADKGSAKDLYIRMILEVANAEVVNLKVDPTVILATKKDVDEISNRVSNNTDALNQDLDTHKAEIASEERDGHMTKKDKTKLNRINSFFGKKVLPSDESDKFEVGVNVYLPNVTKNDASYVAWRDEVASVLELDSFSDTPFRLIIKTIKNDSNYMMQRVYVYSNGTTSNSTHWFTIHRGYGFRHAWRDWRITRPISLFSNGSPEGSVYSIYGSLCLDTTNNKLYIKKYPRVTPCTNVGWEPVGVE